MIIDGFLVFSSCLGHYDNLEVVLGSHSDLSHLQYILSMRVILRSIWFVVDPVLQRFCWPSKPPSKVKNNTMPKHVATMHFTYTVHMHDVGKKKCIIPYQIMSHPCLAHKFTSITSYHQPTPTPFCRGTNCRPLAFPTIRPLRITPRPAACRAAGRAPEAPGAPGRRGDSGSRVKGVKVKFPFWEAPGEPNWPSSSFGKIGGNIG